MKTKNHSWTALKTDYAKRILRMSGFNFGKPETAEAYKKLMRKYKTDLVKLFIAIKKHSDAIACNERAMQRLLHVNKI